jgi:hypothetical protein
MLQSVEREHKHLQEADCDPLPGYQLRTVALWPSREDSPMDSLVSCADGGL